MLMTCLCCCPAAAAADRRCLQRDYRKRPTATEAIAVLQALMKA